MKQIIFGILSFLSTGFHSTAQKPLKPQHLYLDVHYLPSGKVSFSDVAGAHAKDLAIQGKYKVKFLKYWVDESKGIVYCLSQANDSTSIRETHREAHGLLPQEILQVTPGMEAIAKKGLPYFLDVHKLGAGKVTAKDVEGAHQKDLAVQEKHGVRFINYWVNEKTGVVVCLSQASDSIKVIDTHREAHGLLPDYIAPVKQGQ